MYPDDAPPPRNSMTYVTIQPMRANFFNGPAYRQNRYRKRTTKCDLRADVDEDKEGHEVDVTQAHHLPVPIPCNICSSAPVG